jgi:hypothetical protein
LLKGLEQTAPAPPSAPKSWSVIANGLSGLPVTNKYAIFIGNYRERPICFSRNLKNVPVSSRVFRHAHAHEGN